MNYLGFLSFPQDWDEDYKALLPHETRLILNDEKKNQWLLYCYTNKDEKPKIVDIAALNKLLAGKNLDDAQEEYLDKIIYGSRA